jgi:hypothetical protein
VVEPAEVLDDGQFEVGAGVPDAVGDKVEAKGSTTASTCSFLFAAVPVISLNMFVLQMDRSGCCGRFAPQPRAFGLDGCSACGGATSHLTRGFTVSSCVGGTALTAGESLRKHGVVPGRRDVDLEQSNRLRHLPLVAWP